MTPRYTPTVLGRHSLPAMPLHCWRAPTSRRCYGRAAWLAPPIALDGAKDVLPADQRAEIREHLQALKQLGPIPAVPCHLDYTPRNLLATTTADVAVIDFEHSRYDLAARDLVRLATRVWANRPDLERAFLHGYGPLSNLDRHIIEHCSYLDTLTAAVRAAGGAAPPPASWSSSTCPLHLPPNGGRDPTHLRWRASHPRRGRSPDRAVACFLETGHTDIPSCSTMFKG